MKCLTVVIVLLAAKVSLFGFSLIGPYANWMQATNGYHQPGDMGGPMDLGQGYRWNVPIVTYAFDKSFTDFFGSNGVAAVEQAIGILNDLPPASTIVLSNYPLTVLSHNFPAQDMLLLDLKSATLALLLEQIGLGQATRNIFDIRHWDPLFSSQPDESNWPPGTIPNLIVERNFDPETLAHTPQVNSVVFVGSVIQFKPGSFDVEEIPLDPESTIAPAIAGQAGDLQFGEFWTGLSRDDLGGLRYLLSTNLVNLETLLPDVHGAGTNTSNFVNIALRPGVEKITFVRQQYDSITGLAVPITNQFVDTYITNNTAKHQSVERVITQPDFLFSAGDIGDAAQPRYTRTTTANWWSSATVKASTNEESGLIVPPVNITFGRLGAIADTYDDPFNPFSSSYFWGTFDGSTNPPIVYPAGSSFDGANLLSVHLWLSRTYFGLETHFDWKVPVAFGATAALQMSTNLTDWVSVATVTNVSSSLVWEHQRSQPKRFFRVVPQ